MNINDAFPSNYLRSSDLQNQDIVVQMDRLQYEEIGGDELLVLYFLGKKKGIVLNKTNAQTIAGLHGPETDAWHGKTIILWATQVDFKGQSVPCIRVKLNASTSARPSHIPPKKQETIVDRQQQDQQQQDGIPF